MAPKRPRPPRNDVSPQEQALFLDAVQGVVALGDRTLAPRPVPPPQRVVVIDRGPPPQAPLFVDMEGERYRVRAAGVSKAQIAELAAGKRHVAATLDLHGKTADEAVDLVRAFLQRQLAGQCVLLVHGKGLHSGGLSVLRNATIGELMGASSGMIHGFATAAAKDGGEGATYVWVKR
jgi:DNA-nicking Smr family endonuclease